MARITLLTKMASIAAIAIVVLVSNSAFADGTKKGGVQVKGSAVQIGVVQQNNNIALGKGAKAKSRVSSVTGDVEVGKDLVQIGVVKTNNNIAFGKDAEACSEVATLGSQNSACD